MISWPRKYPEGFTLAEVMIVILISGILFSIGLPLYRSHVADACKTRVQGVLERVANEQEKFHFYEGLYSSTLARLGVENRKIEGHQLSTGWIKNNDQSYFVEAGFVGSNRCGAEGENGFRLLYTGVRERRQGEEWIDGW